MPSGIATYHCDVKITNRFNQKSGLRQSAVTAAAYRAGEDLYDRQTETLHSYGNRKGVYDAIIIAPANSPDWVYNRGELWNRSDIKDTYKNAQLFRNILVALPLALEHEDNKEMTIAWVQENFVSQGMIADVAFHDMDSTNPHAHIMLTMRHLEEEGFGNKNRDWNRFSPCMKVPKQYREKEYTTLVTEWRENWSYHVNSYLEQAGIEERVSDKPKAEQERVKNLEPEFVPIEAYYMEERGIKTIANDNKASASIRNDARRQKSRHEGQLKEFYNIDDHYQFMDWIGLYWDNSQKSMIDDFSEIDSSMPSWSGYDPEMLASIAEERGLELG